MYMYGTKSTMALGKTLNQQRTRWSETQKFSLWKSKLVPSFLVASLQCWSSSLAPGPQRNTPTLVVGCSAEMALKIRRQLGLPAHLRPAHALSSGDLDCISSW
jgi:hypothetical protein